jgi:serine/threonine protein phosphatase 1
VIIISDIHGCLKTFQALLDQLPDDKICIAGDMVDRGPDSRGVIKLIRDKGFDVVKGNHEDLMIKDGPSPRFKSLWAMNGGYETIDSYKKVDPTWECGESIKRYVTDVEAMKKDIEWLKTLPPWIHYKDIVNDKGEYLLVSHSMAYEPMLRPDLFPKEKLEATIMWSRNFHSIKPIPGVYNIFGHTPHAFGPRIKSFYACIDTGAGYNSEIYKRQGYGVLTAVQFPSMKIWTQENID